MEGKRVSQSNLQVKQDMYKALMKLLETKELSKITVTDISSVSKVSRMSFYRNYNSIEDILKDHLSDVVEEYRDEDSKLDAGLKYCDESYIMHCFTFFKKHKEFLNVLIDAGMGDLFLGEITEYLLQKWKERNHYKMSAFAGAIYNTYREWKNRNFKESPKTLTKNLIDFLKECFM